jgi:hypothetical protein
MYAKWFHWILSAFIDLVNGDWWIAPTFYSSVIRLFITLQQLKLNVTEVTQTKLTPFWNLVFQEQTNGTSVKIKY